jgi:hypothetical protein
MLEAPDSTDGALKPGSRYAVASGDEATFFRAFWKIPGQSLDDAEGISAAAVNSLSL